jgi:aflatoxin B1 aldehyde reductase
MDTKLYPTAVRPDAPADAYSLRPEDLRRGLKASLKALGAEKVDMWYLHGPDRKTPFEDTMRGVNELYKEGLFERWGVSNLHSWEVARMCEICESNGWVKPRYVQFPPPFLGVLLDES